MQTQLNSFVSRERVEYWLHDPFSNLQMQGAPSNQDIAIAVSGKDMLVTFFPHYEDFIIIMERSAIYYNQPY